MSRLSDFFAEARKEFGIGREHEDFKQITSLPCNFKSSCWHNNVSPSLSYCSSRDMNLAMDELSINIWIDPKDKDFRECDAGGQFILEIVSYTYRYSFVSDNWQDILDKAPKAIELVESIDNYARESKAKDYDSAFQAMSRIAIEKGFERG